MRREASWTTRGLIFAITVVLLQCGSDKAGPGDFCDVSADCSDGLVCVNNICIKESNGDCNPACPAGRTCFEGQCVPIGNPDDKDGDGSLQNEDCNDFDPGIHPGAYEYCDGIDNDCDGGTDEDCPACPESSSQECGTDLGECTLGVQTCSGGRWDACSGTSPTAEDCDGKDNDCDGLTDEICPCNDGDQLPCSVDEGICSQGVQNCESGSWTGCNGQLPQPEVCDSGDNDCDGLVDEGFNVAAPCRGVGECGTGAIECAADLDTRCSSMPGGSQDASSPEQCDMLDNDCDGLTDEELEADQAPNSCEPAQDLGGLPDDGSTKTLTGNLWPPGDEDWYKVTATDDATEDLEDGCDRFHFRVTFAQNPGNQLRMDVYIDGCTGDRVHCTDDTEYEHAYDDQFPGEFPTGQCPCSAQPEEGKTVCSSENRVFYIRIHGPGSSCDTYQLSMSNGGQ